ncbi:MAG TPA: hypothetical protein VGR35_04390 [Tepidisphaeraceae bacterium]|nr:hypothetical protein [Tepidisphaeraceae bacterium]
MAAALLACGWLIRDGLFAVSTEVRNKQAAPFPTEIRLGLGNPDITVTLGPTKIDNSLPLLDATGEAPIPGRATIDNLKVEVAASQPTTRGR